MPIIHRMVNYVGGLRQSGFGLVLWLLLLFSPLCPGAAFGEEPTRERPLVIDIEKKEVLIAGFVQAREYNKEPLWPMGHVKNWHAVVWAGGRVKKSDILFVSYADDTSVYEALVRLGAEPGDNLTLDTWNKRKDPSHPEPNKKVKGSEVTVSVRWEGAPRAYLLREVIDDPKGRGFSFNFGGNKEFIPVWRSGCIVCLYSCPGGKVSNAAYSANDYAFKATRFTAREDILPPDGTPVIIIVSVHP